MHGRDATHNLHNILTLRGAVVRDAHGWAGYLDEAIALFAEKADVLFAQHHWPRWGRERMVDFLATQRDLYGYIHDQTVRLLNKGLVGSEIAEQFELPPSLGREWHCRGHLPPGRFHRQPLRRAAVRRHRGPDRRPARGRP